jgi:predicted nuclease with TOPRIM domain
MTEVKEKFKRIECEIKEINEKIKELKDRREQLIEKKLILLEHNCQFKNIEKGVCERFTESPLMVDGVMTCSDCVLGKGKELLE